MTLSLSATQVLTLGSPAIALVLSGCFLCIWRFFDRRSYLPMLALAFLFYAAGAVMQILNWPADPEMNSALSAGIYLASIGCMAAGILRRYGVRAELALTAVCVLLFGAVAYYHFGKPDLNGRTYTLNFGIGAVLCAAAWRIRRATRATRIDRCIFWVFALFGMSFFPRTLLTMALPLPFVPNVVGSATFWLLLQLTLVLTGLILALALLVASLADMIARLRDDRDIDGLTGLWNRRALDERAASMIGHAGLADHALLLIDIDHFKSINDRYGHATGDHVLKVFGSIIRDTVGADGLAGRVGGEEFAIVVQRDGDAAQELAQCLADQLREVRLAEFAHDHVITASTGLSMLVPGDNVSSWMRRTDALLYQAKRDGRNRVVRQTADPVSELGMT
ncbi:diguanylate cyclase domain-containing protein [Pseudomonadota bacterium AL_CKDN230030165-1A_HGKHYDSX7]